MSDGLARRLLGVVDLIGASLEPDELLQQLSLSTQELFRAAGACWCSLEGEVLMIETAAGLSRQLLGLTFPVVGSGVGALLESGERSLVSVASRFPHLNDQIYSGPEDRMAIALASVGGWPIGALYVVLAPGTPFGESELEVLELLASHAAIALHHVALYAQAETARQESTAVVESLADGVAVVEGDGTVRTWNTAMAQMTRLPRDEAIGRPVPFPLPEAGEVVTVGPDDGRWLDVLVSPAGAGGERVVSARDVTAAKELEAAQELFLATASHELRTPLTVLRGFGDTLLRHWHVLADERRRELVATMLGRTEGMAELVEQILLASQAGLGTDQTPAQRFDLAEVVEQAVEVLAGASDGHPLRVDAERPVMAMGRAASIPAILDQLVENAVKYSPQGGPVEVVVRQEAGAAVLTVADRGRGIAPSDVDRVFERFYRGEICVGGPSGAGLGLWIVRRTVEAQAGQVAARPREGGGTVLEVRLPA